jgi:tetratricopeptide (TPR) repeat protein
MQRSHALRAALAASAALILAAVPLGAALAERPSGGTNATPSTTAPDFDAAAEYRRGIESLKAHQFDAAKRSFAQVLSVVPSDANANFLAGLADAGLNDLKSAARHYEKAVRADRKLIQAHQELGVTYVKLGDVPKAQATLGNLHKLSEACNGTCKDAEEIKKAVDAVQSAIGQNHAELRTEPPLLFESAAAGDAAYLEAVGLINEHRYEDAIAALQRARTSFGAHPDILTYLGFANRKMHRYAVAESYYRQALAVAPDHKGATEYFGELMIERGDLAGANRMLAKLDSLCTFGCAEAEDLRRWVKAGHSPES